ncbi:hypothetical protein QBZ16_002010 [Prototheca wickerhamii]|uniref:DWNN domain-containing protein n=1 Tax=Prototheca wickerhamii TaxID=3111 RepID=A0AAD9ILU5_PROWI|nr:hypothetical protein QBZ16_002010 [Prototheca wickerhamii]
MTSVINFRFKNALQQDSVTFDGSVIQVGDIKRLIAVKRGLGVEGAQELTLFDSTTSEELTDETKLVPRSSLVLVKRAPVTRFKPLTAAAPVVASAQEPKAPPPSTSDSQHDDFGGGLYSSTPPVASAEEEALDSLLAGQAATWQREVSEVRCGWCEAVGAHWLQDCPTQGDPAYDRKRVRPPIGIPLTRLGQAEEGGLVLPDGTTGTLVPNEDAFAQEILGLPTLPERPAPLAIEGPGANGGTTDQEGPAAHALALPAPPGAKPPPPPGSPTRAGASAPPPGSPAGPAAPPPPQAGPAQRGRAGSRAAPTPRTAAVCAGGL